MNLMEFNRGEMQSPAPGEEQSTAPVYTGSAHPLFTKDLGEKGPGSPGSHGCKSSMSQLSALVAKSILVLHVGLLGPVPGSTAILAYWRESKRDHDNFMGLEHFFYQEKLRAGMLGALGDELAVGQKSKLQQVGVHLASVLQYSFSSIQFQDNPAQYFINHLNARVERTISEFGDDTKLGSAIDCIEGWGPCSLMQVDFGSDQWDEN